MLKSLQEFIRKNITTESEQDSTEQLQLAAAALMFEVIASDGHIEKSELESLRSILEQQFELSSEQIEALYETAQESAHAATDLHRFTRTICDHWDNQQRVKLIENMWLLSLADNRIDTHERHLVRKVAGLLYLTEPQLIKSRENARQMIKTKSNDQES